MPQELDGVHVILGLAALLVVMGWTLHAVRLRRQRDAFRKEAQALDSRNRSQSTRYGQISEQFAPWMANWPWDPKQFRFIGAPIDGIQFTDNGIVLVEIKSARSQLSAVQRQVRDHVQAGRVYWHEHRIE